MKTNIPDDIIPVFKQIKKAYEELRAATDKYSKQLAMNKILLIKDNNNNYIFDDERLID